MADIRSVGIPSPRVEGEQKVGGGAKYAVDVSLPGMLWAKVLRSPMAHGADQKNRCRQSQRASRRGCGADRSRSRRRQDRQKNHRHAAAGRRRRALHGRKNRRGGGGERSDRRSRAGIDRSRVRRTAGRDRSRGSDAQNRCAADPSQCRGIQRSAAQDRYAEQCLRAVSIWKKGDVEEGFRQSDVVVENTFTVPGDAPGLYRTALFFGARQCRTARRKCGHRTKARSICAIRSATHCRSRRRV